MKAPLIRSTMETRVVLDTKYATLWYHPDGKIVHHKFHGPLSGPPFREVLTTGLELFKRLGARKWLSDDRANGSLTPDDGKWAIEEWSPQVVKAGWDYWAIIMPDAALGRANMRRFIATYKDLGVGVQIFDNPDEALAWLRCPQAATGT